MDAHRRIYLHPDFQSKVMPRMGWSSLAEAARAAGISPTTMSRLARRNIGAGEDTIAGLLSATRLPFARLFVID